MDFTFEDCKTLVSQMKHDEKQLRLRRRWLMGLSLSKSEQKQLERLVFLKNMIVPESLLRDDDVSYETVKASIQKRFGLCNVEKEHKVVHDNMQLLDSLSDSRNLLSLLDNMTNKGLCQFAEIVTGGSTKFEKTHRKMKKTIQESLPKLLDNQNNNGQVNIMKQLAQLLIDPHNFRLNCVTLSTPTSESCHAAAVKVLDGLEDLPFQTLSAMHRKLRGIRGYMPKIRPSKSGWGRDSLIDQVRKCCLKMLSEHAEGDELQEPLVKALAVAGLTQKLIMNCPFVAEFQKFSPEIVALQNDIVKAIWLLDKKVRFPGLKNLQLVLDPNAELSNRSLRTAIRNLLTEFLLECSDMDTIPECLFETIAIINRSSPSSSYKCFSIEETEEEVECVLTVSAQMKQIVWDLLPEYEFDKDFSDVYMEDWEENDDDDDDADQQVEIQPNIRLHSIDSNHLKESFGETNFESPSSRDKGDDSCPSMTLGSKLNGKLWSMHISETASMNSCGCVSSPSYLESNVIDIPKKKGNQHQFRRVSNLGPTEICLPTVMNNQGCSSTHCSPDGISNGNYVERLAGGTDLAKNLDNILHCSSGNTDLNREITKRNTYLTVQEASDETSMIAHSLIGCILDEFAQREGPELDWCDVSYLRGYSSNPRNFQVGKEQCTCEEDVVIQVLEQLIPSFPIRGKERLKDLMGLK